MTCVMVCVTTCMTSVFIVKRYFPVRKLLVVCCKLCQIVISFYLKLRHWTSTRNCKIKWHIARDYKKPNFLSANRRILPLIYAKKFMLECFGAGVTLNITVNGEPKNPDFPRIPDFQDFFRVVIRKNV